MLVSTSMITYVDSNCSSDEHSYVCVSSLESLGNNERRLTIKLLELELSLSGYLSLPSRENAPSRDNDECIG